MSAHSEVAKHEQELVKLYKRKLEDWREILYYLDTIFLWEKIHYPAIISGFTTLIFIMLWYFDPSVLTAISFLGIIVCLLDYGIPILSGYAFDPNKWTGAKERKFEETCLQLVRMKNSIKSAWVTLKSYRDNNSKVYFIGVLTFLVFVAWIGNSVNNLLLTYFLVLVAALYPGIKQHEMTKNFIAQLLSVVAEKSKHE